MAHWVEGDDSPGYSGNKSSYVNLDVMSSVWVENVSGTEYIKCVDANGHQYTLVHGYASSTLSLAALANLVEGYTVP